MWWMKDGRRRIGKLLTHFVRELARKASQKILPLKLMAYLKFAEIMVLYLEETTIKITCPCNVDPLTPHFNIVKLGFTGVNIIFLFLL